MGTSSTGRTKSDDPETKDVVASSAGSLPIETHGEARIYNLTVLVRSGDGGSQVVTARAANLALPEVEASTIREALSKLVNSAKTRLGDQLGTEEEITWIDPPNEPSELECRYVVPLHL